MTTPKKHRLILSSYNSDDAGEVVGFIIDGGEVKREISSPVSPLTNVVEGVAFIKEVALRCPEISELGHTLIRDVGIDGLRDFVRVDIDGELMAEIRNRTIPFNIPLLQAIDAVNGDDLVSIQTGLNVSYKESEFVPGQLTD